MPRVLRALFLRWLHRTLITSDERSHKLLFVALALLLSSGAFATFAAGEARAEEPRHLKEQAQQQPGGLGEEAAKKKLPSAPPPTQTPPPVDWTPSATQPEPGLLPQPRHSLPTSLEIEQEQEAKSGGTNPWLEASNEEGIAQQNRYDTGGLPTDANLSTLAPEAPSVALVREAADSGAVAPSSEPASERPIENTPAALGENGPAPSHAEETLPVPLQTNDASSPRWEERPTDEAAQGTTSSVPYPPAKQVDAWQPRLSLEAPLSGAVQTSRSGAASVSGFLTNDSPGPATSESNDSQGGTPKPSTPLVPTPVGHASFSLSGGGLGSSSGIASLLLCILPSTVILLRRHSRLAWGCCEGLKPTSALLAPLERPG